MHKNNELQYLHDHVELESLITVKAKNTGFGSAPLIPLSKNTIQADLLLDSVCCDILYFL